jgi:hypothetical protein
MPLLTTDADGALIARVGAVLSTTKVALGPEAAAVLPAKSLAVPAAIEMPSVPFPVMPEIVTVREAVPAPDTATVPVAPAAFKVIFAVVRVTESAPV